MAAAWLTRDRPPMRTARPFVTCWRMTLLEPVVASFSMGSCRQLSKTRSESLHRLVGIMRPVHSLASIAARMAVDRVRLGSWNASMREDTMELSDELRHRIREMV